jgi:probable phosphoglycerate mutase
MKLYFARHGESEANRLHIISNRDLPHPLTDAGYSQALALAEAVRFKPISRVYSSPILRARQTGEILATRLLVPLYVNDALREPDCGELEGRGDPEAWSAHQYWMAAWLSGQERDKGPLGGETCETVQERFSSFVKSLVTYYGPSPVELVLVTHGATMLLCLPGLVEGLEPDRIKEKYLGYASLLCVVFQEGKFTVQKAN